MDAMLLEMRETTDELHETNIDLAHVVAKLDIVVDERAPKTRDTDKRTKFKLVRLNDPRQPQDYYCVRAQAARATGQCERLVLRHPQAEVVLDFDQPNAMNLFNLVKEKLGPERSDGLPPVIRCDHNHVRLVNGCTHEEFERLVTEIHTSRATVWLPAETVAAIHAVDAEYQ